MHIEIRLRTIEANDAGWLAVGVFENETEPPAELALTTVDPIVRRLLQSKDLTGSLGEVVPIHGPAGLGADALLLYGLGGRSRFGPAAAFSAGVALAKKLAAKPRESVACVVPSCDDLADVVSSLTQGLIVGTRGPGLRKTEANRHPLGSLRLLVDPDLARERNVGVADLDTALTRGRVVGGAINLARDLGNTPPAEKQPPALSDRIAALAREAGVEVEVWDHDRIRAERFGGLVAVSAGSAVEPRFVVLRYQGPSTAPEAPEVALIGKGITFDSGGLSLKPTASMEDMKADMTGAAVVTATVLAAARLELPVRLVGYLAIAENMTGGGAMKLGDVLTIRSGKTVEVLNTDAEGRLILADALSYAAEQSPACMVDLATLTGACLVALGTKIAGLFATDDDLAASLLESGRSTGERAWRMPLDDDFLDALKSQVADLKNVGGRWGGAITAAKFLQQFVGSVPWAHLDIAGPSWAETESSTQDAGASGCFVRTLIDWLRRR